MKTLGVTFYCIADLKKLEYNKKAFLLRQRTIGDLRTHTFQVPADQKCLNADCTHTLEEHYFDEINHGAFCLHKDGDKRCTCEGFHMLIPDATS